jgi:aryl-alcohol dehydrogenase-like predicted oxidoreductase
MTKLALGTAQFGCNYGIANVSGQVKVSEAKRILELAGKAEIDLLDTAIAYGDSEAILGKAGVAQFDVVSKLPGLPQKIGDLGSWVEKQVRASLARLGVGSLHGLLLHRTEDLLGDSGKSLIDALVRVQSSKLVRKLGVSIYDPSELDKIMHLMRIDLVQAPLNLIDRRLETSGWLSTLQQKNVEVHTRSAFLQGLLLMSHKQIPDKFRAWQPLWDNWAAKLKENNASALEACLAYPLSLAEVDRVVVGIDNLDQLKAIISASKVRMPQHDFLFMTSQDKELINPSSWIAL